MIGMEACVWAHLGSGFHTALGLVLIGEPLPAARPLI
jgi:hypothetical protein